MMLSFAQMFILFLLEWYNSSAHHCSKKGWKPQTFIQIPHRSLSSTLLLNSTTEQWIPFHITLHELWSNGKRPSWEETLNYKLMLSLLTKITVWILWLHFNSSYAFKTSSVWFLLSCLKPVLNWANVCLPNILQTLRRTMIRFLTELLVCRIWFGQSKLYFILNWLVMRCKLRPELAADAQQTASLKM